MVRHVVLLSIFLQIIAAVVGYEKIKSNVSEDFTHYISFLYFKGPTTHDYVVIPYEDGLCIPDQENFNENETTVFYLPGWGEKPQNNIDSINTIAQAYLTVSKENLVVLDYSQLIQSDQLYQYLLAVTNITNIGAALGYFLEQYIPAVQPIEKVHLVSHSLGSQIMSKTATAYGQGLLYWLTGLDAAGPVFNFPLVEHLSKDDAQFVDVIHTDGGYFGESREIGHVDFYPNSGTRYQPACIENKTDEFCSHHMSWRYYAASITNETIFPATTCGPSVICTFLKFACCEPSNTTIEYMGAGVNRTARGKYYLKTGNTYPYGLGLAGLQVN